MCRCDTFVDLSGLNRVFEPQCAPVTGSLMLVSSRPRTSRNVAISETIIDRRVICPDARHDVDQQYQIGVIRGNNGAD